MIGKEIGFRLVVGLALAACAASAAATETCGAERYRPRLFKQFGEINNVPDGLTQDEKGNIFHSAPNLIDNSYPGVVLKRCVKTGKWSIFVAGAKSPKTGVGRPMGLEYCREDGNLYYCDNAIAFLNRNKMPSKKTMLIFYILDALVIFVGAGVSMSAAWAIADITMAFMCFVNIPACVVLGKVAYKALEDYCRQKNEGRNPVFKAKNIGMDDSALDFWK